jgi:serine/threonine protein kinase
VAIKIMQPSRARNPEAKQRFLREGRTAAAISHPHVLTVYGVGDHNGNPYIVMQHPEGRPLSACLRPMPLHTALRIGREIASGLAAAHSKGLVHRDVKPHNIILEGPHQRVRIIDFGLAIEPLGPEPSLTADGVIVERPRTSHRNASATNRSMLEPTSSAWGSFSTN